MFPSTTRHFLIDFINLTIKPSQSFRGGIICVYIFIKVISVWWYFFSSSVYASVVYQGGLARRHSTKESSRLIYSKLEKTEALKASLGESALIQSNSRLCSPNRTGRMSNLGGNRCPPLLHGVHNPRVLHPGENPAGALAVTGGGDSGVSGEETTHPKPCDDGVPGSRPGQKTIADEFMAYEMRRPREEAHDNYGARREDALDDQIDDEGFDFEVEEEDDQGIPRWLVIARSYSGQNFNPRGLFEEMSKAWGLKEAIQAHALGDNKFMIECNSKSDWEHVVNGGLWRHKGDALLVVAYDGFTRPSDVQIDKINLWVRVYDVPEALMTTGFARSCGLQVGEVLEVGGAVRDFLQIRVAFPLEMPLKKFIKAKVKGRVLSLSHQV
jgi:hypothetical protein